MQENSRYISLLEKPIKSMIHYGSVSNIDNIKPYQLLELYNQFASISKFSFDSELHDYRSIQSEVISTALGIEPLNSIINKISKLEFVDVFLKKYPVLKKLKDQLVNSYKNYVSEIEQHYLKDHNYLKKIFSPTKKLGEIVRIETNLGDNHQAGKSVALIYFSTGFKLIYKPRSGDTEEAINHLLITVNSELNITPLKTPLIYNRGKYCWMEYVDKSSCQFKEEIKHYYINCGVLLGIINLLRGTDMHFENIIPHHNGPVIIDTECLFQVMYDKYTPINTGLIPFFLQINPNFPSADFSGYCASGSQFSGQEIWDWIHIGSEKQSLELKPEIFNATSNQPSLNGNIVTPKDWFEEIVNGFRLFNNWILSKKRNNLLENIFDTFRNKTIRICLRNTIDYRLIIENSYTPPFLKLKKKREEFIKEYLNDLLFPIPICFQDKVRILKSETLDLINMDIPYFTMKTTCKDLFHNNNVIIKDFLKTTPYDTVINSAKLINDDSLEQQIELIRNSFIKKYC